jgi:hypothetical protein
MASIRSDDQMHEAEQITLDLAGETLETRLQEQWRRNMEADAHNWTPEAMARSWAGIHPEVWPSLPSYERDAIVRDYQAEQTLLDYRQESWDAHPPYWYWVYHPDGSVETFYRWPRPFRIPDYRTVQPVVDQKSIDDHWARAKAMADQLSADWSANRPPSVMTYDPTLASTVSAILGRKVDSVMPEDTSGIPASWVVLHYLEHPEQLEAPHVPTPLEKQERKLKSKSTEI